MDCVEVVENLSQREKNSILHVLQRDEQLRQGQEEKISNLKREINLIRMCSVLRAGDDQSKICLRCRTEMGILFNRGSLCPSCKYKVCKSCQEVMFNGSWLCKLCYKQRQLKWLTGEWTASFEQNPLRKWASGSDLVKASLQMVPGTTSIDIDESPSNHGNNKQGKKVSRNGVGGADQGRTRVEVPKEGDQLKLSELFNVLRVKKPEDKVIQETQVRRITSRKYSESDSDSSSNSDIDIKSTSTAPSVTESELDGRRIESPRGLESPPPQIVEPPMVARVHKTAERYPTVKKIESPEYRVEDEAYRPKPSPRSPKPAARRKVKSENLEQENITPMARPRTKERRSDGTERVVEGQVSMSRSMEVRSSAGRSADENELSDKGSVHSELNLHVAKTKESLDKKSRSQVSLDSRRLESDSSVRPKSKEQIVRKSADSLSLESKQTMNTDQRSLHKSDNQLDRKNGADIENKRNDKRRDVIIKSSSSSREPILVDESQMSVNQKDIDTFSDRRIPSKHSIDKEQSKVLTTSEEEGLTQRTGSPYSFSMDSLPSSHPSPTLNRCSFSSNPDSDTDSVSRLKGRPDPILEQSPSSSRSAKTVPKGENKKEDIVVEEISKVQFRRVSKTVGQLGSIAKMSLSPNRKKLASARDSPRESPRTLSECSVSQDDSGNVSGGSRGTTPEHRRTDSSYSQSSLPSTLSNVTDEDEDIDHIVARVQKQSSRGSNLLSVFGDSRESLASYYSDAGDIAYSNIPITGEILFSLNYNYKTNMLEVGVKQCRNIAVADTRRRRSDPYVKTYLLPDRTRGGKRKTKVKKHSTSPTFDETLKYSLTKSELENRTLWLTVWHNDRFGRNVFLGEVTINFDYYKFEDPFPKWYPLQERMDAPPPSMMVYKGDLSLCVRFVPAEKIGASPAASSKQKKDSGKGSGKGQLEVMVKEARNLTAVRSNGFSDPFCKGYLLPERHKSSKQKTAVIKKDCSPVWNHTFVFEDVTLMELRERCLELTIWDYEKLASNDFLGGVRLNLGTGVSGGKAVDWMDARGEEMSMWQAMLDRPNVWIDGALILRPNMDKRKF